MPPQESIGSKIVDFKKIEGDLEAGGQVFMLQLPEACDEGLHCFQVQGENGATDTTQELLSEFFNVFKEAQVPSSSKRRE